MKRTVIALVVMLLTALVPAILATAESAASYLSSSQPQFQGRFGGAISANDRWAVVAERSADIDSVSDAGALEVFDVSGELPLRATRLRSSTPEPQALFGRAVAVDGDRIAVASVTRRFCPHTGTISDEGRIHIFDPSGPATWTESANLVVPAGTYPCGGGGGTTLLLSGDRLVVPTSYGVWVYDRGASGWGVSAFIPRVAGWNPSEGRGAISPDGKLVALVPVSPTPVVVLLRETSPGQWSEMAQVPHPLGLTGVNFPASLQLDERSLVVSAMTEDDPQTATGRDGAVYLFDLADLSSYRRLSKTYPSTQINGFFGANVAMRPTDLLVASPLEPGVAVHRFDRSTLELVDSYTAGLPADGTNGILAANSRHLLVGGPTARDSFAEQGLVARFGLPNPDLQRPAVVGVPDREPNANGWYNAPVTVSWTATDPSPSSGAPTQPAATHVVHEGAGLTVTSDLSCDPAGNCAHGTMELSMDRTPPLVQTPVFSVNPTAIQTSTVLTAVVGDELSGVEGGEYFVGADPGAGNGAPMDVSGSALRSTIVASFGAGVHPVSVRSRDKAGNWSDAVEAYLVVYDPDGGFVTGGGSIASPPGAYAADAMVAGPATFGFVSRYRPGTTTPTGSTEFHFRAAGFFFRSDSYEWLVVSGARAQFKGIGSVNGQAGYSVLISAVDGSEPGGGGSDRLRLKVWTTASGGIVYDNEAGASDTADASTALRTGSILIHRQQ